MQDLEWKECIVRAGTCVWEGDDPDCEKLGKEVEPWLSALLQAEHLGLLVGSGLTAGIAHEAGSPALGMGKIDFGVDLADHVNASAAEGARRAGRGEPNIEDQIRSARQLIEGLRVLTVGQDENADLSVPGWASAHLQAWEQALDKARREFLQGILATEAGIRGALTEPADATALASANRVRRLLGSFLLTFASRATSRERLNIFTTNYDRASDRSSCATGATCLTVPGGLVERPRPMRRRRAPAEVHFVGAQAWM